MRKPTRPCPRCTAPLDDRVIWAVCRNVNCSASYMVKPWTKWGQIDVKMERQDK